MIVDLENFEDAMSREDWDDWCYATGTEINGMTKMDVFSKESYTIDQLRRMGGYKLLPLTQTRADSDRGGSAFAPHSRPKLTSSQRDTRSACTSPPTPYLS